MSKRLIKRASREVLEQKLRKLDRRENELHEESYFFIELEKPLFQGYRKHFVLRQDLKGRPDYSILEKLLPLIDNVLFSKTKDFTKKQRRKRKKLQVPIPHTPREILQHQLDKLNFREKSYFSKIEKFEFGRLTITYRFNFPWMLVPKTEKHFVTKIKVENLDVRSELQEIKNYVTQNGLRPKLWKLIYNCGTNYRYYNDSWLLNEKQIWKETQNYLKSEYHHEKAPPQYFEPFKIKNPKNSSENFSDFSFLRVAA